jgi:hypothetical protein
MMTKLSIADLESSNVFLVNNMTDFYSDYRRRLLGGRYE